MTPCCGGEFDHRGFGFERTPDDETPFTFNPARDRMIIKHPTPPGAPPGYHRLAIYRDGQAPPERPAWLWDGNERAPTIRPSIKCTITGWHGFLTAGRMEHI